MRNKTHEIPRAVRTYMLLGQNVNWIQSVRQAIMSLLSRDDPDFNVLKEISQTIADAADNGEGDVIPLPLVQEDQLEFIRNWAKTQAADFSSLSHSEVRGLLNACNYLDADAMLDVVAKEMAGRLTGKSVREMRLILGQPEVTPEEEEKIREENGWIS